MRLKTFLYRVVGLFLLAPWASAYASSACVWSGSAMTASMAYTFSNAIARNGSLLSNAATLMFSVATCPMYRFVQVSLPSSCQIGNRFVISDIQFQVGNIKYANNSYVPVSSFANMTQTYLVLNGLTENMSGNIACGNLILTLVSVQ